MPNLSTMQFPNDNNEYTLMDGTTFIGTNQEWNSLSAEDKAKYRLVNITDDDSVSPEPYTVIASSSTGNTKTNREKVDEIYTAYCNLSLKEKYRSGILINDFVIAKPAMLQDTAAIFSAMSSETGYQHGVTMRLFANHSHLLQQSDIAASSVALSDISTTKSNNFYKLVLFNT